MPVKLRIKGTDKYLKMNSGKYIWNTAGHAKAALSTSGLSYASMAHLREAYPQHPAIPEYHRYRNNFSFSDVADIIEVEEYKLEKPQVMKDALALIEKLEDALYHTDIETQYPDLIAKSARFRKENK